MVVYVVYGFRWLRIPHSMQAPGIRAHIVTYNLLDAAADYLQEPATQAAILKSFKRIDPNIFYHMPGIRIIEQYDPNDTGDTALCQPYAYVAAKVITFDDGEPQPKQDLSLDMSKLVNEGPGLSDVGMAALERLRDFISPDQKIGWWIVYNGDPERWYPSSEGESTEGEEEKEVEEEEEEETESNGTGEERVQREKEKPAVGSVT